jgi:hypothetical protein
MQMMKVIIVREFRWIIEHDGRAFWISPVLHSFEGKGGYPNDVT